MAYKDWFDKHAIKHEKVLSKLKHLSDAQLIDYFVFENMVKVEPDFCPLYEKNKKCHDVEYLNCYLCACPNFRFNDDGFKIVDEKKLFSTCNIDSKDGAQFIGDTYIHQNCAGCGVPHKKSYVKKHFLRNWKEIMKDVPCS